MIRVLFIFQALGCVCFCGFVVIHSQDFPFGLITSPRLQLTPHWSFISVSICVSLGNLGKLVSLAVSPLHCDSDRMETSFILSLQLFQLNVHLMSAQCQHPQKKSVFAFFSIENICLYTGMIRISDTMFSVVL